MASKINFEVLYEEISADNVLLMSECLALQATRQLICFNPLAINVNSNLYYDILHKNEPKYSLSDSYDLVQAIALFLCEHFGEQLEDSYFTHKGKEITIRIKCYRIAYRIVSTKFRRIRTDISLQTLSVMTEPSTEMTEEKKDYTDFDNIISKLGLNEYYSTILNCRMSGMSFPEIGRIVGRQISTVWEALAKIRRKYMEITTYRVGG